MNPPAINYPCHWAFTLIGTDERAVRAAVARYLEEKDYRLRPSNKSRSGKYISLHLDTEVENEEERNRLFAAFKAMPAIKMVL
ncbi:MAG: DUF493 domain-containing protein [Desulfobacterales bacterium]|nr:DUF493 domain-containing protein [Desulfobacterales bacterium]MDJ0885497.1 DUF493 domain-containing protein [Desulfobacterales bacterium]